MMPREAASERPRGRRPVFSEDELRHAAHVLCWARDDVVKGDEASLSHERRIHAEIRLDPCPRVVAVDEEHVD